MILPEQGMALIPDNDAAEMRRIADKLAIMEVEAANLIIHDLPSVNEATQKVVVSRKVISKLNGMRLEITRPLDNDKKMIMSAFAALIDGLGRIDNALAPKIAAWQDLEEKRRIAAEEEARRKEIERLEAEQKEQEEQAALNESDHALQDAMDTEEKIEEIREAPMSLQTTKVTTQGFSGSAHRRKHLAVEVTDWGKVPVRYYKRQINEALVKEEYKAGGRDFPGLKIIESSRLAIR